MPNTANVLSDFNCESLELPVTPS